MGITSTAGSAAGGAVGAAVGGAGSVGKSLKS
jgi:hypothetical protein